MPSVADYRTLVDFDHKSIENINSISSSSTPTSFGFKESAYKIACVIIKNNDF